jgi:hypothetical protein
VANPLLVNEHGTLAADFRLSGASPDIDRGTTVGTVTMDYFGSPRYQGGAYEIGAHEVVP